MCDYLDETVELSENGEVTHEDAAAGECPEVNKDDLLKYYKDFLMNGCLPRFSEYMGVGLDGNLIGDRQLNDLPYLDYSNIDLENDDEEINNDEEVENDEEDDNEEEIDHSRKETDDYYFCKYGIAYAFEYAMFYDIMLRIHDISQFGVCSFGSGGYIDAWSLAYARARLQEQGIHHGLKLYYQGIDIVQWPTTVFSEAIEKMNEINRDMVREFKISVNGTERTIPAFTFRRPQLNGIQVFNPVGGIASPNEMNYNVLMFSKLLNVVKPRALEVFIRRLSEFDYGQLDREGRPRDYYICVSHSPTTRHLKRGVAAVQKIVQMFRNKHFKPTGNLQDILGEEQYNNLCDTYGIEIVDVPGELELDDSIKKYYKINGKNMINGRIWDLNPDFQFDEPDNHGYTNDAQRFLQKLYDRSNKRYLCRQTSLANIAFQIIKLTKSEG